MQGALILNRETDCRQILTMRSVPALLAMGPRARLASQINNWCVQCNQIGMHMSPDIFGGPSAWAEAGRAKPARLRGFATDALGTQNHSRRRQGPVRGKPISRQAAQRQREK